VTVDTAQIGLDHHPDGGRDVLLAHVPGAENGRQLLSDTVGGHGDHRRGLSLRDTRWHRPEMWLSFGRIIVGRPGLGG
jgi:hypothetical protein